MADKNLGKSRKIIKLINKPPTTIVNTGSEQQLGHQFEVTVGG